jgi:hypothetical protein
MLKNENNFEIKNLFFFFFSENFSEHPCTCMCDSLIKCKICIIIIIVTIIYKIIHLLIKFLISTIRFLFQNHIAVTLLICTQIAP